MNWFKKLIEALIKLFKTKKEDPTPTPTPTPTPDPDPTPTPDPEPTPEPTPVPTGYTVTNGQNVEKHLKVPCSLSYTMTGKLPSVEDGSALDGAHLCWAYEKSWNGGNVTYGGGMIVGVRDYCVKSYNADGSYAGQIRYSAGWDSSKKYAIKVSIMSKSVQLHIDNALVLQQSVDSAESVYFGYGWPPSGRPGCEGAVLTNVVWEGEEV